MDSDHDLQRAGGVCSERTSSRCVADGGGVSRLTSTMAAKLAGTPNSPAEIGCTPHQSSGGPLSLKVLRNQGWAISM